MAEDRAFLLSECDGPGKHRTELRALGNPSLLRRISPRTWKHNTPDFR